jgi:hypothetical protein
MLPLSAVPRTAALRLLSCLLWALQFLLRELLCLLWALLCLPRALQCLLRVLLRLHAHHWCHPEAAPQLDPQLRQLS